MDLPSSETKKRRLRLIQMAARTQSRRAGHMTPIFEVDDRVRALCRLPGEPERFGTLESVYPTVRDCYGRFQWMYSVTWDDNHLTEYGYLGHCIEKLVVFA